MNDLISRQEAINAINAQCDEWEKNWSIAHAQALRSAIPILDTMYTEELEKILCKECRYITQTEVYMY